MDELGVTLTTTGVCLAAAVFCGWRGALQWDIRHGPRLMPWRFLMLLLAAIGMLAGAHAMTLLGIKPAQPPGPFG